MTPTPPEIRHLGRWAGPLLAAVATLGLLLDLGGLTLRQWDEARLAVNALEMSRSSNWLVATFAFEPDLWNTKPPLMLWLQAGLLRLLGPTEWAIRLPGALSALAAILVLYWFLAKFLRRPLGGLLAGSVLVSALGFLGEHHGHAGDYDALLTLAQLATGLSVLLLLETGRSRWWWGVGIGLLVATLTKGVAALLPVPGMALYCLAHRRGRQLLRRPGFWLVLLAWGAVAAGWYGWREHLGPGYWAAVNYNELGGRFSTELEKHHEPWYYYFQRMARSKFLPWFYVLPVVIPFALRHPDLRARRVAWFALSWAAGLLLVLSIAKTRVEWYMLPAYPWLALLVGLGGPRLATWLLSRAPAGAAHVSLRVLLAALVIVPPLITIRHELRGNWHDLFGEFQAGNGLRAGYGLRELRREAAPPAPLAVVAAPGFYRALRPHTAVGGARGYNASLRFYVEAYPRPVRVVPPAAIATLRGPGYVLTASATDSARVRAAFPRASCRAVGRYACWLWSLPPSP
ncbi:ArnT family glycosyltransferase [uncultured Hymenobacter sp.]|uniref:ArnT family glycosyltransferase n=1 Tax=uncultured Hymenobacter sp. TaxID=170016 RepID=UPI0035CC9F47